MAVKATAKQLKHLEEILDGDYDSVAKAAKAVWEAMSDLVLERAQFAVVAQLRGTRERPKIEPSDPESLKAVLGYYSTPGEAQKAAESLAWQPQTGDKWALWTVPIWHLSPAELTGKRREQLAAKEHERKNKIDDAFRASIAAHHAEMLKRAQEYQEKEQAA